MLRVNLEAQTLQASPSCYSASRTADRPSIRILRLALLAQAAASRVWHDFVSNRETGRGTTLMRAPWTGT